MSYVNPIMKHFFKEKPLLSIRDKKNIGAMFFESNYELTKMLDMDIAKYGYQIKITKLHFLDALQNTA